MTLKRLACCITLLGELSGYGETLHALTYNEATDGDLPDANPLQTLVLDVGLNVVRGAISADESEVADFDSFAFSVPAGARVTAASLEIDDVHGNLGNTYWRLYAGSASVFQGTLVEIVELDAPGSSALAEPVGPGLYNFSHESFGYRPPPPAASNYAFTFEVVPEPAAMITTLIAASVLSYRPRYIVRRRR